MMTLYVIENRSIIYNTLFNEQYISHRTEFSGEGLKFVSGFLDMIENGQYHAVSGHKYILYLSIIVLFLFLPQYLHKDHSILHEFSLLVCFFLSIIMIAFFYGMWHSGIVRAIRGRLGGLWTSFQVDRFYFLNPCIWYIILAIDIALLSRIIISNNKYIRAVLLVIVCLLAFKPLIGSGTLFENYKIIMGKTRTTYDGYASWNEFYSERLFQEIKEYINKPIDSYRVCSVGLYPEITLYNGFYTIDGYPNEYPLEYKKRFRKIIEKELEKNDEIRQYFDLWGNRCYVFSSELSTDLFVTKYEERRVLNNIELNMDELHNLNCRYLLSSVEIESDDLSFVKKFTDDKALYDVYLYEL